VTHFGLEQMPKFSWMDCTLDWWSSWSHPQWLWREPWMRPVQTVHSHCWQLITLTNTVSDLFSVSVAETRKKTTSPEFESYVYPSPSSTMGMIFLWLGAVDIVFILCRCIALAFFSISVAFHLN